MRSLAELAVGKWAVGVRRVAASALAVGALAVGAGSASLNLLAQSAEQVTVRVVPEMPAIGEAITVELRVRAPVGSDVRFPDVPDSSEAVEPLDPREIRDASTAQWLDRTAVYRLIAWDTGSQIVRFGDISVRVDGVERNYRVSVPPLRIQSLLPADSTGRVPRPARAYIGIPGGYWKIWLGVAVLLALAAWAWYALKKRKKVEKPPPDAAIVAKDEFKEVDALGLLAAAEFGRHAIVSTAVLRNYLARRYPQAAVSLTASEMHEALIGIEFPILPERVFDLLKRVEPIAFAAARVSGAEAGEISAEARKIIEDIETAIAERNRGMIPGRFKKKVGGGRREKRGVKREAKKEVKGEEKLEVRREVGPQ